MATSPCQMIVIRVGEHATESPSPALFEPGANSVESNTVVYHGTSSPLTLSSFLSFTFNAEILVSSSRQPPGLRHVYRVCGPTFPGHYAKKAPSAHSSLLMKTLAEINDVGYYYLKYPGVAFRFPIPWDDFQLLHKLEADEALPFILPASSKNPNSRAEPVLDQILLYSIDHPVSANNVPPWCHSDTNSPSFPATPSPKPYKTCNELKVTLHEGIRLALGGTILFGMSLQDVYQELGPPDRVTIKDLDVVCVMLGSADFRSSLTGSPDMNSAETVRQLGLIPDTPEAGPSIPDYFCNYFRRGFDILFCGVSHRAKKIVLQSNLPGHIRFGDYARCFFSIHVKVEDDDCTLNVNTTWDDIQRILGPTAPPLLVAVDKVGPNVYKGGNPNQQVRKFYGYPGMALEIFNKQWIASVTLF